MLSVTLNVKGMSCGHCVSAVESALKEVPGIESVDVNLKANKVTVSYDESLAKLDKVKEAIEEAGYDVV
jgi:copper chaperone